MSEVVVTGRGALRSLPSNSGGNESSGALARLADYCKVERDFLHALPISADGNRVAFNFAGLAVRKLRAVGTKDIIWDPADAACPPLWPLPDGAIPSTVWLTEGETDCIVARYVGFAAFALTKGAESPLTLSQAIALKRRGVTRVVVCLDADKAGRSGTTKLAKVLSEATLEVRTIDLGAAAVVDSLLGQKDLRDGWLSLQDRDALRTALETAASEVHHLHIPRESEGGEHEPAAVPVDLSTLGELSPVEFVVEDFLPKGYPSTLYADSGQGKSYLGYTWLYPSSPTGRFLAGRLLRVTSSTSTGNWTRRCSVGAGEKSAVGTVSKPCPPASSTGV